MPPKPKITRDMIVDAGLMLVREAGIESVNARAIAEKLDCSTQPVMYHFKKMEELRQAIYQKADACHTAYIMDVHGEDPLLSIGLAYIRFAQTEKNMFRLLFQSNEFAGKSVSELINAEELALVIAMLSQTAKISREQAKAVFKALFVCVHGYAGMYANNALVYNEEEIAKELARVFYGVTRVIKEDGQ